MYSLYRIPERTRVKLLKQFPPKYERVLAHHVTVVFGGKPEIPPKATIQIIDYLNVPEGLELFTVMIDDRRLREDWSLYHITWSLNPDEFDPVDSNWAITQWKKYKERFFKPDPPVIFKGIPEVQN